MTNDFVFTVNQPLPAGVVLTRAKGLNYQAVLSPKTGKISSPFYAARRTLLLAQSGKRSERPFNPKEGQIWMSPNLSPAGFGLNVNLRLVAWEPFIALL